MSAPSPQDTWVDVDTWARVRDVVARHAHLFDNRSWEALDDVYLDDAAIGGPDGDLEPVGSLMDSAVSDRVFFPHHTTDTVVHRVDATTVRAWSKYLVVRGDGTAGSGDYQDTLVLTPYGWRISERRVSRGHRLDTDPDGPSERTFTFAGWRGENS